MRCGACLTAGSRGCRHSQGHGLAFDAPAPPLFSKDFPWPTATFWAVMHCPGTGESTDVERDDVAIASDIRPDHLLRGADGASDPIELDSSERSPMLDDAREQIDTLASDDDAAPGDATGQDAGNAEDGDSD